MTGYQVNLLPADVSAAASRSLDLPAVAEVHTGLGANGNEFEVRSSVPDLAIHLFM